MKIHDYARVLIKFRGQDLSALKFLGPRWIALKVVLVVVGIVALLHSHAGTKYFGVFVLGYVFGVVVAGIRSHVVSKWRWPLQERLYDWTKIESLAKGRSDSAEFRGGHTDFRGGEGARL